MLADAGDEHNVLLRKFDQEGFDVATSSRAARTFLARIDSLFNGEACWTTGYTAHCLKILGKPRTIMIACLMKTIGGFRQPLQDIKTKCLNRMRNWVFLSKLTIDGELPWCE